MAVTDKQRAAYTRYRESGKRGQINITTTRAVLDDIAKYAQSMGMRPAECARDCIRRCMALDGWRSIEAGTARGGAEQCATIPCGADTSEPQPPKRKRGRPRKNQAE